MPYYHGSTRLNLYSASPMRYPTSDSSGATCVLGTPSALNYSWSGSLSCSGSGGCSLTMYDGGSSVGSAGAGSSGSYTVSRTGSVSYSSSPYFANGERICYNVSRSSPSAPALTLRVNKSRVYDAAGNALYSPNSGNPAYYHVAKLSDSQQADNQTASYTDFSVIAGDSFTLTKISTGYWLGTALGSFTFSEWTTDNRSQSISCALSGIPNAAELYISVNSEGTYTGGITLSNGSWSGYISPSSWKALQIRAVSISKTTTKLTYSKSQRTRSPSVSWQIASYYAN